MHGICKEWLRLLIAKGMIVIYMFANGFKYFICIHVSSEWLSIDGDWRPGKRSIMIPLVRIRFKNEVFIELFFLISLFKTWVHTLYNFIPRYVGRINCISSISRAYSQRRCFVIEFSKAILLELLYVLKPLLFLFFVSKYSVKTLLSKIFHENLFAIKWTCPVL